MEKSRFHVLSSLCKWNALNALGLAALIITLALGKVGWFALVVIFGSIAWFEYQFRFFSREKLTPYVLMLFSPLLLVYYTSITDFSIRIVSFVLLAYVFTVAAQKQVPITNVTGKIQETNETDGTNNQGGKQGIRLGLVWLCAFLIFSASAVVLHLQGIQLSGDEPHYLMISQSLIDDGDFDLKNNMDEKTYFSYLPVEIRFHGGNYNGKYYSFHTPGVSFLLLPFYWLFTVVGLGKLIPAALFFRLVAAFFNAFFALCLYILMRRSFPSTTGKGLIRIWLFFLVTFPLVFHGIHLYPELLAATLMMAALILAEKFLPVGETRSSGGAGYLLLAGLCLAGIPWLHIKYSPAVAFLGLVLVYRIFKLRCFRGFVLFSIFPIISLGLLLLYSKGLYGSYNPAAIFPSEGYFTVPFLARVRTLLAYFFDQRDGLLFYSPLFFLAFLGWKRKFHNRGVLLGLAWIYILLHANTTLRGAYSPAGRPLMFVSWILLIFVVNYFFQLRESVKEGKKGQGGFFVFKLLGGLSLFVTCWLFYYPLFVYQPVFSVTRERAAGLLTFFGGSFLDLPQGFPSFLSVSNWGYIANYAWLGLFGLVMLWHYLLSANQKDRLRKVFAERQRIISFFLFLGMAFLFCFFPHVHLIEGNSFKGKNMFFYNNSRNFFYLQDRGIFRIKAGNAYDLYFDLGRMGIPLEGKQDTALEKEDTKDQLEFQFSGIESIAITVRNGAKLLYPTASSDTIEGRFSLRLSKLGKLKIKGRWLVHLGIRVGDPPSTGSPFVFLEIN